MLTWRSELDDFNLDWTFPRNHFDFIHMRWLIGSVNDWNAIAKRAFDHLKPGGWFETYEMSAIIESDDSTVTDKCACAPRPSPFSFSAPPPF